VETVGTPHHLSIELADANGSWAKISRRREVSSWVRQTSRGYLPLLRPECGPPIAGGTTHEIPSRPYTATTGENNEVADAAKPYGARLRIPGNANRQPRVYAAVYAYLEAAGSRLGKEVKCKPSSTEYVAADQLSPTRSRPHARPQRSWAHRETNTNEGISCRVAPPRRVVEKYPARRCPSDAPAWIYCLSCSLWSACRDRGRGASLGGFCRIWPVLVMGSFRMPGQLSLLVSSHAVWARCWPSLRRATRRTSKLALL